MKVFTNRHLSALVVFLLALHALASLWSASRESATWDEPGHIGAGYAHLVLNDPRFLHTEAYLGRGAPLAKLLIGASVRTLDPIPVEDPLSFDGWANPFGYALLYGQGDGRAILRRARLPIVALSLLLGLAVFLFAQEMWGSTAALAALFLYVANSEMLAHSHYATRDLPMALMSTLFLWGLWRFLHRPSEFHGIWVSVAFAVAVTTKYSFPVMAVMGVSMALLTLFHTSRRQPWSQVAKLGKYLVWLAGVAMLVTWLAVWATFSFIAEGSEASEVSPQFNPETVTSSSLIGPLITYLWGQKIFPEDFLRGLAFTANLPQQTYMSYLFGRTKMGGWWYYFPFVFLLKTPLPLLLLLAMTPFLRITKDRERIDLRSLAIPVAVYFAMAMCFRINIGYRHLLPCIPLLFVWAGCVVRELLTKKRLRWLAVCLLAWYAFGVVRVAPHFLSFFNELAGGPDGGHRYVVDSNTDWGQDLDELARVSERLGLEGIKLSYFGSASPDAAGVPYSAGLPGLMCCWKPRQWASEIVTGDVVAVSVTNLRGAYFKAPEVHAYPHRIELDEVQGEMPFVDFLEHLEQNYHPFAQAGHSILLYRLLPEYRK